MFNPRKKRCIQVRESQFEIHRILLVCILLLFVCSEVLAEKWESEVGSSNSEPSSSSKGMTALDILNRDIVTSDSDSLPNPEPSNSSESTTVLDILNRDTVTSDSDSFSKPEPSNSSGSMTVFDILNRDIASSNPHVSSSSEPEKPLNIVFVRGYGANSKVTDKTYQMKVKRIFKGHNVKFVCLDNEDLTRGEILGSLEGSDLYFLNAHGCGESYNGMQCLQVAPSDDNSNKTPGGNSVLTSLDIKKALHGKKKPKVVILNVCNGINPSNVPPRNLFSAAFGIDEDAQGKAFISWKDSKYGFAMDSGILSRILGKWAKKNEAGEYPRLKDIYSNNNINSPFIVGDTKARLITDEYFVIFQPRFPMVKEGLKIEKRDGESKEDWKRRRKAYYQKLGFNDFVFQDIPLEENPIIIKVVEDGMGYYPEEYFTEITEFSLSVNGIIKTKEGGQEPLEGSVLLTRKGLFYSFEELLNTYPLLKEKREKIKVAIFDKEDGFARKIPRFGGGNKFTIGPVNKYWTNQDRKQSVVLAKTMLMWFDCFIAHAVYGDSAAKQITVFREFRDKVLKKSPAGQHLIQLYYEYGPEYAIQLRNNPQYIPYVRWCLDRFSSGFERINFESPELHTELNVFMKITDKIASIFFKEGGSQGVGQIARIIAPHIWLYQEGPVNHGKPMKFQGN